MSTKRVWVREDTYVDSVQLMSVSRAMREIDDVEWAGAGMGTQANRETLHDEGFSEEDLDGVGANDLVLAVRAASDDAADEALSAGRDALQSPGGDQGPAAVGEREPRTLDEALETLDEPNLAVISVPGRYAALEAHKALTAGLHVMLFSDNVPVSREVDLKKRAAELGLLVMGPDAGTAMLAGVGLGFANVVDAGPVGVVAAAGTGAQEVMALLHRWGVGVAHVIGVGGRDLSDDVGGRMTIAGIRAARADPDVSVILVVSKPPSRDVAETVMGELEGTATVCAFLGLEEDLPRPDNVRLARTLEEAVLLTLDALGRERPPVAPDLADLATSAADRMGDERRAVRGLFSGGTLCYESMLVMSRRLGPVHSNTPLRPDWDLPAPDGAHVCLDLGEDEYTEDRPHPMIDPEARLEHIEREADDEATAVILLDVVLGHGAHDDPGGVLAPTLQEVAGRPDGPAVVAYVLGTDLDPQGYQEQRDRLEDAGCLLAPTGARAALLAAAIAAREPKMAGETP